MEKKGLLTTFVPRSKRVQTLRLAGVLIKRPYTANIVCALIEYLRCKMLVEPIGLPHLLSLGKGLHLFDVAPFYVLLRKVCEALLSTLMARAMVKIFSFFAFSFSLL